MLSSVIDFLNERASSFGGKAAELDLYSINLIAKLSLYSISLIAELGLYSINLMAELGFSKGYYLTMFVGV